MPKQLILRHFCNSHAFTRGVFDQVIVSRRSDYCLVWYLVSIDKRIDFQVIFAGTLETDPTTRATYLDTNTSSPVLLYTKDCFTHSKE